MADEKPTKAKFVCRFCKLQFDCASFEEVQKIQNTQCWITVRGINHSLIGVN